MEAFLVSTGVVALAEIGDKTQLLAFVLATRFKRPLPIIAGILAATLVNHAAMPEGTPSKALAALFAALGVAIILGADLAFSG